MLCSNLLDLKSPRVLIIPFLGMVRFPETIFGGEETEKRHAFLIGSVTACAYPFSLFTQSAPHQSCTMGIAQIAHGAPFDL